MSSQSDGQERPGDIDTIKQLLRKLEEVAVRDAQLAVGQPAGAVGPDLDPVAAEQPVGALASDSDPVLAEQPVGALASDPDSGLTSLRQSLARRGQSPAPGEAGGPILIDLPSPPRPVPEPAVAIGGRRGKGLAIAAASFAMGIAAAAGLLVVFEPLKRRLASGPVTAAMPAPSPDAERVASAPAPAVRDAQPAIAVATAPADGGLPLPSATATTAAPPAVTTPAVTPPAVTTVSPAAGDTVPTPGRQEALATEVGVNDTRPTPAAGPATEAASPAPVLPPAPLESSPVLATPPPVKPVAVPALAAAEPTPSLKLSSSIEIKAGERIRLPLGIAPALSEGERLLLVFRGVPRWLSLSPGGAVGDAIWLMPAQHGGDIWLESSVSAAVGSVEITIQLARVDGRIVTETKVRIGLVAPPPAAPATIVASPTLDDTVFQRLQARGELLLDTGEIEAARTLLRSAAEAGSVAAALRLAETYDPGEVYRLGVMEGSADPAQAVRWYERAQALGSTIAASRLASFGKR